MVESREWKGRGGNDLSAGACEREDCLRKIKSFHTKNRRKRSPVGIVVFCQVKSE